MLVGLSSQKYWLIKPPTKEVYTMRLTQEQKQDVAQWIAEGAKLSEVQQRLGEEFGIRLTYMEARFLMDDLQLVPQDKQAPVDPKADGTAVPGEASGADAASSDGQKEPYTGGVRLKLDTLLRPGSIVSGSVTFGDGVKAEWYLDQTGRLGLVPEIPGYRPTPEDSSEFMLALKQELGRMGMA
jgi:hypothetical protein